MVNREDWLLIDEVADIARVSPETVRYWIKKKRLPSVRPGRWRLVRRDVLEVFLLSSGGRPRSGGGR
jgi:excisionase family DNA binding protein